jgi:4-amino-4-deoxy-L-arabinose transferase-like glycosyltransferase
MNPSRPVGGTRHRWIERLAWPAFFLLIGLLLFSRAMAQPFSHDEHQFVASGWWLANAGLIPYRDFPYHHMPYQIPLDALAVRLSPYLLLSARLVSWVAGWLASGIILLLVRRDWQDRGRLLAAGAAATAVIIFVSNPISAYTTGQAWNHDWGIALALLALMLQVRIVERPAGWRRFLAVGVLSGLAAGVRLSLAVLCPLFLVSAWLIPGTARQRWGRAGAVLAGTGLAGLPAALLLALDTKAFGYGNVLYPILNSQYREVLRHWSGDALLAKFEYFGETVLTHPANVVLLATFALVSILAFLSRPRDAQHRHVLGLTALATVLLFLTAFAPTPSWYQYFYACVPFAILTIAFAAAKAGRTRPGRWIMAAAALAALGSILGGHWDPDILRRLQSPEGWVPVQVHRFGEKLAAEVPCGRVLTLGPLLPMEGGLLTYEALTAGPFTFRVAHIIPEANRRMVGWVGKDDLEAALESSSPAAILTGLETANEGFEPGQRGNLEVPLDNYAANRGFRLTTIDAPFMPGTLNLWLPATPSSACTG